MFSKESMKIEYHDYPDQHALVMKRALEIFSPLNPTHLKNFSYSVKYMLLISRQKIKLSLNILKFMERESFIIM